MNISQLFDTKAKAVAVVRRADGKLRGTLPPELLDSIDNTKGADDGLGDSKDARQSDQDGD